MKDILTLVFISLFSWTLTFAQPGTIDLTFNSSDIGLANGDGANNNVYATCLQSDGKIIIGGIFTSYNGTAVNRIARLNTDGTIDTTFDTGTGVNSTIYSISMQSDGKIIIGGSFTTFNGVSRSGIARLNTNGSLDNTFNPGTGVNNGTIKTTCIQSDGRIIIGGGFTSFNGTARNRIARISSDGSIDLFFNPGTGANSGINSISMQSDGKFIIGGGFTSYNGIFASGIARINTNGTLDSSFVSGTGAFVSLGIPIYTTCIQNDGKIIIGGDFTSYNSNAINRIARLNVDGSLDTSFNVGNGASSAINSISIQNDGKIIIGGFFSSYNNIIKNRIARLNTDGTIDNTFTSITASSDYEIDTTVIQSDGKIIIGGKFTINNGTTKSYISRLNASGFLDNTFNRVYGGNSSVWTTSLQSDGKIIIGGDFTVYNNTPRRRIARLNTDGSLDTSFNSGLGADGIVYSTAVQSDGKIIIGGDFTNFNSTSRNGISRLNTNGSIDNSFNPGTGTYSGDIYAIHSISVQNDGKIIIGGNFTSYNGTTVNRIARLNSDGTLDFSFNPGTGANDLVYSTKIQSDGKIIIGGRFTSYNGTFRRGIARLNVDGTIDPSFNPGSGTTGTLPVYIATISIQSDGKIIIGGGFNNYNGTSINRIARINSDGSLDGSFNPTSGADGIIYTSSIQSDAKIIIGGEFSSYNGTSRNNIARLNTDGSLDTAFNPGLGANNTVWTNSIQNDGKIIIGGQYTSYNSIGRNRVARINGNTSLNVNDFEHNSVQIYPNPSKGVLQIHFNSLLENKQLDIYTILGQLVFSKVITDKETSIDISNQPKGVYIYNLYSNNSKIKTGKIVVE